MRRFGERNRRTRDVEATPEMLRAAEELFTSIQQVMIDSANRIAIETPPMIDAALNTVVEYDKKGRVKATKYLVEVLGRTFEEATSQLAVTRLAAEAQIAVVSSATAGEASRIAEAYRYSAEQLAAAAGFLVAAQADIAHGKGLLGAGATLTQTTAIVEELRRAGEDLTVAYARLIASTANVRDAFGLAGQSLNLFGAELVRFGNAITTAAGGEQAAADLWKRFFTAFYSESELNQHQVDQLKPQLTSGLTALGLDPDTTIEEFRAEFERRLPKLTAAQVVEWLRLGDVLATVTGLVASIRAETEQTTQTIARANAERERAVLAAQTSYADLAVSIDQQLIALNGGGMSNFQQALAQIGANLTANTTRLNELARAAGLSAARSQDLTRAHQLAAAQAAQAARQLELASADIAAQLFGDNSLATAASTVGYALNEVASGISAIQDAANRFRDSMLLDDQLSPLNMQQQLDEALRQLRRTGDEGTARRALEIGRTLTASGDDWTRLFNLITGLVRPGKDADTETNAGVGPSTIDNTLTPAQRLALATQLAQNVSDLAGFGGRTFADVADGLGFTLTQLGSELGLTGDALTDYLESLQAESYGLDDLSTVISRQVDRIVAAISGSGKFPDGAAPPPGRTTTYGLYGDPPSRFRDGTVRATDPKSAFAAEPSDTQMLTASTARQHSDAVVLSIQQMAERVDQALQRLAQVTGSSGEATEDAIKRVEIATRDGVRETRALAESVNVGRGVRAAEVLR